MQQQGCLPVPPWSIATCMRHLSAAAPGREEGFCFEAALHQQQGGHLPMKSSRISAHT